MSQVAQRRDGLHTCSVAPLCSNTRAGEIVFWLGSLVTALPGFGCRIVPWAAGISGIVGIVAIMLGATKRLEKKQWAAYGNDGR